jgi:hypothetical protein
MLLYGRVTVNAADSFAVSVDAGASVAAGELPGTLPPSVLVADLGSSALGTGFSSVVPIDGREAAALLILLL